MWGRAAAGREPLSPLLKGPFAGPEGLGGGRKLPEGVNYWEYQLLGLHGQRKRCLLRAAL